FIPLNLKTTKLFIFVDRSFANNADLTFYNYVATEQNPNNAGEFTVKGNIIYFSLTKYKRVIRSVLASEIYAMVTRVDVMHVIGTTLALITERLAI
ncbi:hypothetical protein LX36DRAFT_730302, partial [Colletotrichum falcatum]